MSLSLLVVRGLHLCLWSGFTEHVSGEREESITITVFYCGMSYKYHITLHVLHT